MLWFLKNECCWWLLTVYWIVTAAWRCFCRASYTLDRQVDYYYFFANSKFCISSVNTLDFLIPFEIKDLIFLISQFNSSSINWFSRKHLRTLQHVPLASSPFLCVFLLRPTLQSQRYFKSVCWPEKCFIYLNSEIFDISPNLFSLLFFI